MLQREPAYPEKGRSPRRTKPVVRKRRFLRFLIILLGILLLGKLLNEQGVVHNPFRQPASVIGLHPTVDAKSKELVALAGKRGIRMVLTTGFRSKEEQDGLYDQGRVTDGPIVTKAKGGHSYHNYGLAVDFALQASDGDVVWDLELDGNGNGKSDWMEVVAMAKKLGFTWGGDWENFPDYPHLQMDFGYSIRKLRNGHYPSGSITGKPTEAKAKATDHS
ncbi:M15 family metallopeptidase [Gorillibacterium timonense]|uniref:M15 family metallopeptidase n=1 Tax=Gorillibacterium timonense TaxID=1689269 RepID=UPI00071E529F|nr:M15 family metallopeptidase [Gorillibacterium timonense]